MTGPAPSRPTRRQLLAGLAALPVALGGGAAYARYVEPAGAPELVTYRLQPKGWRAGHKLRIVAISDLHCGSVHMPMERVEEIVARSNALNPDLILLLGDYVCRDGKNVHRVAARDWARALAELSAPLGVHAILGNHEYWDDPDAKATRSATTIGGRALNAVGIPLLVNGATKIRTPSGGFWLTGIDTTIAYWIGPNRFIGRDDLPGTLARVDDSDPVILMAHEPDAFVDVPDRVALTLSGHTHGGQVKILGWSPYIPSNYGTRFAHGHVLEGDRHLIVSAGLGTSGPPFRFGVPPEIVLIELG